MFIGVAGLQKTTPPCVPVCQQAVMGPRRRNTQETKSCSRKRKRTKSGLWNACDKERANWWTDIGFAPCLPYIHPWLFMQQSLDFQHTYFIFSPQLTHTRTYIQTDSTFRSLQWNIGSELYLNPLLSVILWYTCVVETRLGYGFGENLGA